MEQIIKNIYLCVGILIVVNYGLFFQSCNADYFENTSSDQIQAYNNEDLLTMSVSELETFAIEHKFSSKETNYIAIRFLKLHENKYRLNLTEKVAVNLGISRTEFARMQKEVEDANLLINKWIEDKTSFELSNPEDLLTNHLKISNSIPRLRSGVEPNERFKSFPINNMSFATSSFFAPYDAENVSITCSGGGLLTGYNVYVNSCGTSNYGNGVGLLGTWDTTLKLPCSNTNSTVGGKTTNSFGGTCSYSW